MFYKGKNVLVAGGAGLAGQGLVDALLEQGAYVRATQYHKMIQKSHKNLEVVSCDLTDDPSARSVFRDMEIVFLAAARVGGAKLNIEKPSDLILYNLNLSSKLIALSAECKLDRCTFISSSFVYPDTRKPHLENEGFEDNPWWPMYGLGWVKRYLETLCNHFNRTSDTNYTIIRPTAYYGPNDSFDLETCHVIPALIMKALNGMDPYEVWGNGEEVRSFTYIDDLVEGILLATDKFANAEPLNICTRETHTIKDVVRIVLECMNAHPTVVYQADKPSSIPYIVSDPSRAKRYLDWEAKTTLEEGIKKTMKGVLSLA